MNVRGEVIGINTAIASQTGYYSGYGFAIPITLAKEVLDDFIEHGRVRRAVLGVSIVDAQADDAAVAGLKDVTGVLVQPYTDENPNSPARRAGIEPGDVIVKADGKTADRVSTLQRIIRSHEPGETVEIEAWRYGSKKTFNVRLGEANDSTTRVASNTRSRNDNEPERRHEHREARHHGRADHGRAGAREPDCRRPSRTARGRHRPERPVAPAGCCLTTSWCR